MRGIQSIPTEWDHVSFGKIASFKNGASFRAADSGYELRMLGVGDFKDHIALGCIEDLKSVCLSSEPAENDFLKRDDLVFVRSNGSKDLVGRCLHIECTPKALIYSGFCIRGRMHSSKTSAQYINLLMQNGLLKKQLVKDGRGTNISNLNQDILNKLSLVLPPLPEQKAIADLLSTWDEAIEKTERLIQAKEKRFKQLLNDQIYAPALAGIWDQVKTKLLFKERKQTKRGDLPLLSITNGEGVIPRDDSNRKDTSNQDKSKYLRICPGDIGYNTMRMWQGVSALSSLEGIVSPAYTICIPGEKLYPQFVAFLFKMPFMIHRFYRYSQGLTSDTWNLKFHHFREVKMPLPSIEEQQQIAETLSTARQEIDLLKQLAEKYKTQKRGLMQKMLVGEWRVKPEIVKQYEEA
jgi:type I restriction enzyme S subunit